MRFQKKVVMPLIPSNLHFPPASGAFIKVKDTVSLSEIWANLHQHQLLIRTRKSPLSRVQRESLTASSHNRMYPPEINLFAPAPGKTWRIQMTLPAITCVDLSRLLVAAADNFLFCCECRWEDLCKMMTVDLIHPAEAIIFLVFEHWIANW